MAIETINELHDRGVNIKSLTESDIDTRTPTGRALFGIDAVFAQLRIDTIRDNTRRGLKQSAQDGASDASRTPELVRVSGLGADVTQIGKTRLSRLPLPRQSAPAGSRIHVDATIHVPGAAVWCCRSVDFATFVLAGSALVVAMLRRERR
jgi:resolvase-like protein